MKYDIFNTAAAETDLNGAVDYIEHVLLNPQAAADLLDEVEVKITDLAQFPEKFSLVSDPVLKAWGIRFVAVKNYLIFYTISEPEQRVQIIRFLYRKRDWTSILRN